MTRNIKFQNVDGFGQIFLKAKEILNNDKSKALAVSDRLAQSGLELKIDQEPIWLSVATDEAYAGMKVYAHRGKIVGVFVPKNSGLAHETSSEGASFKVPLDDSDAIFLPVEIVYNP